MTAENSSMQRRNRAFDETHRELIETAVRLIAGKGVEALSIATLARELGINRTTVYYHFENRESLIDEVKAWSSAQLAEAFVLDKPRQERMDHIYHFVLENPQLIKMWIDDVLSVGDIRKLYPHWDQLVEGIRRHFAGCPEAKGVDPEVFCVNLLTSAFIGPRIYKHSVCPEADNAEVVERFKAESTRMMASLSLV